MLDRTSGDLRYRRWLAPQMWSDACREDSSNWRTADSPDVAGVISRLFVPELPAEREEFLVCDGESLA